MKGRVTAIKRTKGYFFVRDSEGRDRFCHANSLEVSAADLRSSFDQLQEGFDVEFEPYEQEGKDNGLRARRVRVI